MKKLVRQDFITGNLKITFSLDGCQRKIHIEDRYDEKGKVFLNFYNEKDWRDFQEIIQDTKYIFKDENVNVKD